MWAENISTNYRKGGQRIYLPNTGMLGREHLNKLQERWAKISLPITGKVGKNISTNYRKGGQSTSLPITGKVDREHLYQLQERWAEDISNNNRKGVQRM